MRRFLTIAVLCFLVSACGLPPAVSIASYVVDSFLLVTGGKSSTDHAISLVSSKDCAMWRVVRGHSVCSPLGADESTDAADPLAAQSDMAQSHIGESRIFPPPRPGDQQSDTLYLARAESVLSSPEGVDNRATDRGLNVRPPITSLTFDSARTDDDVLVYKAAFQPPKREMSLCIGSFQDKEQAQHLRHRFDGHDARIVRAVVDGQLWHRVLLSPPKGESTATFVARFEQEVGLSFWLTPAVSHNTG